MESLVTSFTAPTTNNTEVVATSTVSAQSSAFASGVSTVMLLTDADTFLRMGTNPTAVNTGTDMLIKANVLYRVRVVPGYKLAFILASGTGTARITPSV